MHIVRHIRELRAQVRAWRERREEIGFVPTMGNLHGGHTSLVSEACKRSEHVIVSIFVNPTQFGEGEDFGAYPRTLEQDCALLERFGVDLVFVPEVDEMYPDGAASRTVVDVPAMSGILCGATRPGHFAGVATVVSKLFSIVQPDLAVFGRKDFQQLRVVEQVVQDLNLPVQIVGADAVRESDGLAMSSRNGYLDEEQRQRAPVIYQALSGAAARLRGEGVEAVQAIEAEGRERLADAGLVVDYFTVRRAGDLQAPTGDDRSLVVLAAAWLGKPRLIDNIEVTLE